MLKQIGAIGVIFTVTAVAWMFLGVTVENRTRQTVAGLSARVGNVWGAPHSQRAPRLLTADEKQTDLPAESTRVQAQLQLEPRRKGLLWFNTYTVEFQAEYVFPTGGASKFLYEFPLPIAGGQYDRAMITVDGKDTPFDVVNGSLLARVETNRTEVRVATRYAARGQEWWQYRLAAATGRVKDFELRARTNFLDIDFADDSMAPTTKRRIDGGWELTWASSNLLSAIPIKIVMPERLQPGPLGAAIAYFAPVSLFFFFFVMWMLATVRGIRLHPVNYFFLAAAFFAFHLLFAYLADHLNIHVTFLVCSLVSSFLVVSYLRLVVDFRFAAFEAGFAQFVFLILFSYAQFFQGYAGLTVTVGAVVTLYLVMQLTAKVDWGKAFAGEPDPATVPLFDSPPSGTVS